MANLSTIQDHLETLKSGNAEQKRNKLTPESIADAKAFIEKERANRGSGTHYSLEAQFHEWEDLIKNYEAEKGAITTATASATAKAAPAITPNTSTKKISGDPLKGPDGKELTEEELRTYIFGLAKKELEGMTSNVEKMTSEELEQKIQYATALLDFKWLEKVPGMKDKVKEIMKFDIMMEGAIGAGFITMLEKQGYKMGFVRNNQVAVGHASGNLDAKDFESKINMHLSSNPRFMRMIQTGMLYRQPSFETYRQSVTDAQGKLINPEKTNILNYVEYLTKRGGTLTESETLFLRSARHFDRNMPFASIVAQGKDYQAVMGLMSSMSSDASVRGLLDTPPSLANPGTGPNRTESPAQAANAPDGSGSDGPAGLVGQGIGKIGGLIGKVGEAGIGGGMKVLGEIFREANKAGGGYGTLAVIGLIGYSIFGKKGLGFWGTMGAFFGLGLLDAATGNKFKGMFSGTNTPGSNPAGTPPAPNTPAPAAAVAAAPGGGAANRPAEASPVAPPGKPLTQSALIARAVGKENIHDANVEAEQATISAVNSMNFVKFQTALAKNDEPSWQAAIDSSGYKKGSKEYNDLARVIHRENAEGRKLLTSIVSHVSNNEFIKALQPENLAGLSLAQAMEYVVKKENEKQEDIRQGLVTPPGEIFTMSDGHSNLYLLSRLLTQGYIPQLNTIKAGEIRAQDAFYKKLWTGMKYSLWSGGPLTNNDPKKNPVVGSLHNSLDEKFAAFSLMHVADENKMLTEAVASMKAKNIDGKALLEAELLDRKAKVDGLENILKTQPIDEKALMAALKAYELSIKTKWEVIGNKLGMKWAENGWKLYKGVDTGVYVTKSQAIINEFRGELKLEDIKERGFYSDAVDNSIRQLQTPGASTGIYQVGDKSYTITSVESDGKIKISEWDVTSNAPKANGDVRTLEKGALVDEVYSKYRTDVLQGNKDKILAEAQKLGDVVDTKKKTVISSFEAWEAVPKDQAKKAAAMAALEDYNKTIIDTNGKVAPGFALLSEADAKAFLAKTKTGSFIGDFLHTNMTGRNFGWVDSADKLSSTTPYLKGARTGFIGVGLLSIAYNSGSGFNDLIKDGKIGTAMTRMLDLGIGMVPFVGAAHDLAILTFEDYEHWMLGSKLSEEERNMRKTMVALGIIPGVGMAVKGVGNIAKSGVLLAGGSMVMKSGNLLRSVATYSMLGMSIVHTSFEIAKNNQ